MVRIQIENVTKQYKERFVLCDMRYNFEDKLYLITGPNGSGKSTLLKCIVGCIKFQGNIVRNSFQEIAYMPEMTQIPTYVSINTFLQTMLESKVESNTIDSMLKKWNLYEAKYTLLTRLSKGMLQKVMLSYLFLQESDIYLLDEPLNGLDQISLKVFENELILLKEKKKCVIISTHYPKLIEHITDIKLEYIEGIFL